MTSITASPDSHIDPAAIDLPPTQPIDITAWLRRS